MALKDFVDDLTRALAESGAFRLVELETEGPTVRGRAFVTTDLFLRFFFNEATGTTAFALIKGEERRWGVDYDNRRGWHLHSEDDPAAHRSIQAMSVGEIIADLDEVLGELGVPGGRKERKEE